MQRQRVWRQQITLLLLECLIITQGCQADTEGDLLLDWKSSLSSDPQKKLISWIQGNSPCTWQHIKCDVSVTWITRIDLGQSSLSGTLYQRFGELSKLQYLELYDNNLSGQIPLQLGNLANLVSLDLYQNSLSGTIPATLSNCSQLQTLAVDLTIIHYKAPSSPTYHHQRPTKTRSFLQ